MSIYSQGTSESNTKVLKPKTKAVSYNQNKFKKKTVVTDKEIKDIINKMKNPPKSFKYLLHDSDENIIGAISSQGAPILFDSAQIKDLESLLNKNK